MEKYRFDDAYKRVYVYDNDAACYLHAGTYHAYGLTSNMTDEEKTREVEEQDLLE